MYKKIVLLALITVSCQNGTENLKYFIEYGTESDNYLRWSEKQLIKWEFFQGDIDGDGLFYTYIGIYFFYDVSEELRFNATIYLDKEKSWVRDREEWGEYASDYHQIEKLYKLQFDYYEYTARKLRKYLLENSQKLREGDEIRDLPIEYYNKAKTGWAEILKSFNQNYTDEELNLKRQMIDAKLEELKEFDSRVNSKFL